MITTPKALRIHIGIFGRMNVGKSSFMNLVSGQDSAIVSDQPGTTTDVVEKTMELLPLGPIVLIDTAGIDDQSTLGQARIAKAKKAIDRSDIAVLVVEAGVWGEFEDKIASLVKKIPLLVVINKIDQTEPEADFIALVKEKSAGYISISSIQLEERSNYIAAFKRNLINLCSDEIINQPALAGDLVKPGALAVMIVPIDLQAPKGRLILPQVQTIRDLLDNDAASLIVKEREYSHLLNQLKNPPDLVVCDSQVVQKMIADTPPGIACTTFSILFSRFKGDLVTMSQGAAKIDALVSGDKILISESCSHHADADDIGRVKIPRWLNQYCGCKLEYDVFAGKDFPENLEQYALIIHCGACMTNRREMLNRIEYAKQANVPITNYGICISMLHGVLEKVLSPFPAALEAFKEVQQ